MKTFVTIFPDARNVHLIKDVGQIPYLMHRLFGYDATLVAYEGGGEYGNLQEAVRGLKISFISKGMHLRWFDTAVVWYLIRHRRKIDVLNLYHNTLATKLYVWIFKLAHPTGFAYVKLDENAKNLEHQGQHQSHRGLFRSWLLRAVEKQFSRCVDCVSIETHAALKIFGQQHPELKDKLILMPNGIDENFALNLFTPRSFERKENLILTVGRLGSPEKNVELLIAAIGLLPSLQDWKVCLVGGRTQEFEVWLTDFLVAHPRLKDAIILVGEVKSRGELFHLYDRAKIFALTSVKEGFPLVFAEALFFGNVIITTDVSGASDITDSERVGVITPINDAPAFANALQRAISDDEYLCATSRSATEHARKYFIWSRILKTLQNSISKSHV
jgi:glycosyltransferase involved in cell wall biosynthesis